MVAADSFLSSSQADAVANYNSFDAMYELMSHKIRSYIIHMLDGRHVGFYYTEDFCQEVWLHAYSKWGSFTPRANTESDNMAMRQSWIYRIAHNIIVDRVRREQRYSHLERELAVNDRHYNEGDDDPFTAAEIVWSNEHTRGLVDALAIRGNDRYILTCMLLKKEGYSWEEIAEKIGMDQYANMYNVKSAVNRRKAEFQERYIVLSIQESLV